MLSLLIGMSDGIIMQIILLIVGLVFAVGIVITVLRVVKALRNPSRTADGKTSWDIKAAELAQIMSADELYRLAQSHIEHTIPEADPILGKSLMRQAAEKGNAGAQLYMGRQLDYSANAQAVEWFKKSAGQGNEEAAERLGDIYNYGRESDGAALIAPDYKEAEKWYLPLAEKGNVEVMKTLALMYSLDLHDEESSLKWYIKAAEAGDLEAIKEAVTLYDIAGDTENAIKWCKKAAEAGDAESMYTLARLYEFAEQPDMEHAVLWYKKSAENGYANANVKLALLYIDGNGFEKDEKKGFEMLQAEAANGNESAQYRLGLCYKNGVAVEKDVKKAFEIFNRSQNYFASKYQLGYMYLDGEGVEKDEKKGFEYLSDDTELFDEEALFRLGECYFYGKGIEKDKEKARGLWRKAAEHESEEAVEALDRLFGEQFVPED